MGNGKFLLRVISLEPLYIMKALELERILVEYYLEGSGSELRYIDATTNELTHVLSCTETEILSIFIDACENAKNIMHVFNTADVTKPGEYPAKVTERGEYPDFFRFLVFACYVASSIPSHGSKNFRKHCLQLLGIDEFYNGFHGLNKLWERLAKWCAKRPEKFKKIILPEGIKQHTILGKTQAISFPAWRDQAKLKKILPDMSSSSFHQREKEVVSIAHLFNKNFSEGFLAAWKDYKLHYDNGAAKRSHLPFWQMLESFKIIKSSRAISQQYICLQCDDGRWTLSVCLEDEQDALPNDMPDSDIWFEEAQQLYEKSSPINNAHYFFKETGVMLFFEFGFGEYRATVCNPEEANGDCYAIVSTRKKDVLPIPQQVQLAECNEYLLLFISKDYVKSFLAELYRLEKQAFLSALAESSAWPFVFQNGVKRRNTFLALPGLLPTILINESGVIRVINTEGAVLAESTFQAGDHKLLDHAFLPMFRPEEIEGRSCELILQYTGHAKPCRKKIFFLSQAPEHEEIVPPGPSSWTKKEELRESAKARVVWNAEVVPERSPPCEAFLSLLEAIYYVGKTGLSEPEVLSLIKHALSSEVQEKFLTHMAWGILRTLEESGWLFVRQSRGWGSRKWWLHPPSLREINNKIVLCGFTPQCIRERFKNIAAKHGTFLSYNGSGPFSPMRLCARTLDKQNLLTALDYPCSELNYPFAYHASTCYPFSERTANDGGYHQVMSWNWTDKRFNSEPNEGCSTKNGVTISMFSVEKGNLPKIYRVEGSKQQPMFFDSRTAAIFYGHSLAQVQLFGMAKNKLVRVTNDGYLPLPIAEPISLYSCCSSGFVRGENGDYKYAYPVSSEILRYLCSVFGSILFGNCGGEVPTFQSFIELNKTVRQRLGRYQYGGGYE